MALVNISFDFNSLRSKSSIFIWINFRNRLLQSLETEAFWSMARTIVAVFWDAHGYVWHGKPTSIIFTKILIFINSTDRYLMTK